jgi:hypothetical protein
MNGVKISVYVNMPNQFEKGCHPSDYQPHMKTLANIHFDSLKYYELLNFATSLAYDRVT